MLVDFNRENRCGSYGLSYRDGKEPDGPAAGDGHRLGRDLPGQHGMHGVAQRIEDGCVLKRDSGIELPDIRFGDHDVFGEGAIGIHAYDLYVLADVRLAGTALQALAASHMHLGGNEVAFLDAGDFVAKGRYLAAELVSGNQRRMDAVLRPAVPVVYVQVGAADGRDLDLNQDVGASEGGDLYFANVGARSSLRLDHRQHCSSHDCHL